MLAFRANRSAVRQLSSSGSLFTHRVEPIARVAASTTNSQCVNLPIRTHPSLSYPLYASRSYATARPASRPKAHTGRATASKTRTTTSTKKTPGRPAKKATTTRTRAKSKPKPKAKTKARAKAKPVKRVRKAKAKPKKSEEEKAAEKRRLTIRDLRATALKIPTRLPETVYTIIAVETAKASKGLASKEASGKYKNLTPAEREHYNHIMVQNKAKNTEALRAWTERHSPEEIRQANLARQRLKRMGLKGFSRRIVDERQVKRPMGARILFFKDRYESGEMKGLSLPDATRLIGQEWSDMPKARKDEYYTAEQKGREQYVRDVKTTYNRDITLPSLAPRSTVAAAA